MKDWSAGVADGSGRAVLVVTMGRTVSVLLLLLLLVRMLLLLASLPFFPLLFLLVTRAVGSENGRAVTKATGGAAGVGGIGGILAEDSVPAMALAEAGGPRGFLVGSVRGLERHDQRLGSDMSTTYRTSWEIRLSR